MTTEEKKEFLYAHCIGCPCDECKLIGEWEHPFTALNEKTCIHINKASEEELDRAISILEGKSTEDSVNHPSHYTAHGMECIDEMLLIFGEKATAHFCLLNAWKYRKRAMYKNGQEDMDKADWYIAKYKELKEEHDPYY